MNIAIIGAGYWGPKVARNFANYLGTSCVTVCDMDIDRLKRLEKELIGITTTTDTNKVINSPDIDTIVIATPISTHYDIALAAIKAGKHVWVEKPITNDSKKAAHLIAEAKKRNLILFVDHIFIYESAIRKIKDIIASGEIGEVLYYDSTRINLGQFQHGANVLWDLAVHDLSIMEYLLDARPTAVSATGMCQFQGAPENIAYMTLFYDSKMIAHVNVNWTAPVKVRTTFIAGDKKMIVFDDIQSDEKIKVYDKGVDLNNESKEDVYKAMWNYRSGDIYSPNFKRKETLLVAVKHFVECVETGTTPITDGEMGLRVVKILEAANQSLLAQGNKVTIEY